MTEPAVQVDDEVIADVLSERDYALRSEELAGGIFTAVEEIAELPEGYAYRSTRARRRSAKMDRVLKMANIAKVANFSEPEQPESFSDLTARIQRQRPLTRLGVKFHCSFINKDHVIQSNPSQWVTYSVGWRLRVKAAS